MNTVEIFEPALCCSSGVCGPDVDQNLVEFSADLDWVSSHGGTVARHNMAADPMVFATNDAVRIFLERSGSDGLPLVLVNGATVLTGRYPSRAELSKWTGLGDAAPVAPPAGTQLLGLAETDGCCAPGSGECC
ncbi:arsenite efflux transporter metallochaperone ArsD [Nocardia sp. NRRL WC-3656]|uniref:arsenite efflux transporter metallochaperone ArsD n=1 Tax=Nocardia sp. NRRL WC-3656 TaxID=1463824 RepID=UPI0004C3B882|nr:arsenite efflux transporter metallochaperone ArsD [Nocardia sp. NRRL WC-3656]